MGFSSSQLAQASMVSQIGGAVTGAVGSYYSNASQASSLQFQSGMSAINANIANTNAGVIQTLGNDNAAAVKTVGDFNASLAESAAQSVLAAGQQEMATQTMKAGQVKSSQRASMAANGIDLGEGSAAEVQASTDIMKDIDSATIQANAARTAWGYRAQGLNAQLQSEVQATNISNNATMSALNAKMQATGYSTSSLMQGASADGINPAGSAATSLIGSAGKVASSWYDYTKNVKDTGGKP